MVILQALSSIHDNITSTMAYSNHGNRKVLTLQLVFNQISCHQVFTSSSSPLICRNKHYLVINQSVEISTIWLLINCRNKHYLVIN